MVGCGKRERREDLEGEGSGVRCRHLLPACGVCRGLVIDQIGDPTNDQAMDGVVDADGVQEPMPFYLNRQGVPKVFLDQVSKAGLCRCEHFLPRC